MHNATAWKAWNPITGCTKISEGCLHCYAERMAGRLCLMGQTKYKNGFRVTCHEACLTEPFQWKKPQRIFTCSMGDMFHEAVPEAFLFRVFETMNRADWHTFQILTKRAERLAAIAPKLYWSPNIWMGVTVESERQTRRISYLLSTKAHLKWLCLEPLLSAVPNLPLDGIHWVILGGESGPKARPLREAWVTDVRDQCVAHKVPFYFKQWGGVNKKATGCLLNGREWKQVPQPALGFY